MSEKFNFRIEQNDVSGQEKEEDISEGEKEKLENIIEGCSDSAGVVGEDLDKSVDYILSKYIEKGLELSPQKKASLRRTIEIMLGNKFSKDE